MKKLFILAFAALISGTASAQITATSATTTASPLKFGLKAGVNLPTYHYENVDTKSTTNFNVTAYLDAPLAYPYFSVQPGISLQGKGAKLATLPLPGNGDENDWIYKQNTLWLEVPVNFVGKVPLGTAGSFVLGAGPYLGFGLAGKNDVDQGGDVEPPDFDGDISFGDDANDDLKGTDFGVNFLGGFEFNNGLTLNANYGMGLTDLQPQDNSGKINNRVWSFSIGFLF